MRWILNGSAVLVAAGVSLVPGDLDVVPDLDPANLGRLAEVLDRLDAFPEPDSTWEHGLTLDEVSRWRSQPAVEANLDHRFVTEHGILDVVPRLTGTYDELMPHVWPARLEGEEVIATELSPLLGRLRGSTRRKDRERRAMAAHLIELQT